MLNVLLLLYSPSSRNSGGNLSAVLTRYRTPISRALITLETGAIAGSVLLEMKEEEGTHHLAHPPSASLHGNYGWIGSTISSTYLIRSLGATLAPSVTCQQCLRGGLGALWRFSEIFIIGSHYIGCQIVIENKAPTYYNLPISLLYTPSIYKAVLESKFTLCCS